ncbi:hypothetical protein [Flavobacterium sp. KACC 22763]|uniref:hypothetical protein n=1 Tax=Flavobacterium sp. KACC 22763 TaxID=3025668 RepID=UPI0023667397|nr:hypothetical protein [Flavobacterium sp. KACC 22763]WDF63145.1 hypothetical protein PQ463_16180 [Flavobacterium sp. KACC 22763]
MKIENTDTCIFILVDKTLSPPELSKLRELSKENKLSIQFTVQQTYEIWKKINEIIKIYNSSLQLSLTSNGNWGQWKNLSFLEHLPDLQQITIKEWHIEDLSPLTNLIHLKKILIYNEFKSKKATLKPLRSLKNIEDFASSHIDDIETISCFKKLKKLSLDSVKNSNLDFLSNNSNLETVWLRGTDRIINFSGLSHLPNLEKAYFIRNYKCPNLNFISDLVNLKYLHISDFNQITQIPSLKFLTRLIDFSISNCKQLKDYSNLIEAKSLENLFCGTSKEVLPEQFEFLKFNTELKKLIVLFNTTKKNNEFETLKTTFFMATNN